MSDDDIFYPIPTERKRGLVRWLLLALHGLGFAGVVFGYPELLARFPELFNTNLARVGLPAWGVALVLHLLLAALLDLREGVLRARIDHRRREEYRSLRRDKQRENLKEKTRDALHSRPASSPTPNSDDELLAYDDMDYRPPRQLD